MGIDVQFLTILRIICNCPCDNHNICDRVLQIGYYLSYIVEKTEGQSIMDNPDTLEKWGTQRHRTNANKISQHHTEN